MIEDLQLSVNNLHEESFTDATGRRIRLREPITCFGGEYRFLSNFTRVDSYLDDEPSIFYPSVENAYQAAKFPPEQRIPFRTCPASEAKQRGRGLGGPEWRQRSLPLMYNLVYRKFKNNSALRRELLATGSAYLIEGNYWGDTFWGQDNATWYGHNYLGRILMAVRHRLLLERNDVNG